jgi:hypothetical protein
MRSTPLSGRYCPRASSAEWLNCCELPPGGKRQYRFAPALCALGKLLGSKRCGCKFDGFRLLRTIPLSYLGSSIPFPECGMALDYSWWLSVIKAWTGLCFVTQLSWSCFLAGIEFVVSAIIPVLSVEIAIMNPIADATRRVHETRQIP